MPPYVFIIAKTCSLSKRYVVPEYMCEFQIVAHHRPGSRSRICSLLILLKQSEWMTAGDTVSVFTNLIYTSEPFGFTLGNVYELSRAAETSVVALWDSVVRICTHLILRLVFNAKLNRILYFKLKPNKR